MSFEFNFFRKSNVETEAVTAFETIKIKAANDSLDIRPMDGHDEEQNEYRFELYRKNPDTGEPEPITEDDYQSFADTVRTDEAFTNRPVYVEDYDGRRYILIPRL